MKEALQKFANWENPESAVDKLAEWFAQDQLIGDNFERASVYHNHFSEYTYEAFSHSEFYVNDPRGYSCILKEMFEEIQEIQKSYETPQTGKLGLLFEKSVESINYTNDVCSVTLKDSDSHTGDLIISTVSIGVLN